MKTGTPNTGIQPNCPTKATMVATIKGIKSVIADKRCNYCGKFKTTNGPEKKINLSYCDEQCRALHQRQKHADFCNKKILLHEQKKAYEEKQARISWERLNPDIPYPEK